MKFKKLMLATCLLLAILTFASVSAADDTLAVENSDELSQGLDDVETVEETVAGGDADDVLSYEASDFNVHINETADLADDVVELSHDSGDEDGFNYEMPAEDDSALGAGCTGKLTVVDNYNIMPEAEYMGDSGPASSVRDLSVDVSNTTIEGTLILTDVRTGEVFKENITVGPILSDYLNASNSNVSGNITEAINQLLGIAKVQAGGSDVTVKSQNVSDAIWLRGMDNRTFNTVEDEMGRYLLVNGTYANLWQINVTVEAEYKSKAKATVINNSTDASTTTINATLILTDVRTGEVFIENITVGPVKANYTSANNTDLENNITGVINQLLSIAQVYAQDNVVTTKSENVSKAAAWSRFDNRTYTWFDNAPGQSGRYCLVEGEYGTLWQCNVTVIAEFESAHSYAVSSFNLTGASVVLSKTEFTYNGKVQKPEIKLIGAMNLTEGVDYIAVYSTKSSKNAGTYSISIIGTGMFSGTTSATYTINKATNPLKVKAKTATVKYSKLKKKAQTLKVSKVIKFTKKGQGTMTYAKKSGNKKITINKKTGKVTVKKGLKKGTYKVKVKIKAKGNSNYKASAYKTVTFKIIVK